MKQLHHLFPDTLQHLTPEKQLQHLTPETQLQHLGHQAIASYSLSSITSQGPSVILHPTSETAPQHLTPCHSIPHLHCTAARRRVTLAFWKGHTVQRARATFPNTNRLGSACRRANLGRMCRGRASRESPRFLWAARQAVSASHADEHTAVAVHAGSRSTQSMGGGGSYPP